MWGSWTSRAGGALALLVVALGQVAGCGRGSAAPAGAVASPAGGVTATPNTLPAFPADRGVAGLTENIIHGSEAVTASSGAAVQGASLVLDSNSTGPQFAEYRFNPGAGAPDSVSVSLASVSAPGVFIGLANYASLRWDFSGPYTATKTLAVDGGDYVARQGNVWICVVAPPGQHATVRSLSVRSLSSDNAPPVAALTMDATSGAAPLTVNFDASASSDSDGSIIEYAWDFDGNGSFEEFTAAPELQHVFAAPGQWPVTVRVEDDQGAFATATREITVATAGNISPHAALRSDVIVGAAPLTVKFNADESSDADGAIREYAWDFDGDGTYEGFGATPYVTHTFTAAGSWLVKLRVTDDGFGSATVSLPITVTSVAHDSPVAVLQVETVGGDVPFAAHFDASASLAKGAGNKIVKYEWDFDNDGTFDAYGSNPRVTHVYQLPDTYFVAVQVTDKAGLTSVAHLVVSATWHARETVDSAGGTECALALIQGRPAVGYAGADGLRFARSADAVGHGPWTSVAVDAASAGAIQGVMLAQVAGCPALSYTRDNAEVWYAYSTVPDGSSGWQTLRVSPAGQQCIAKSALAVVDGGPAVSYYAYPAADLVYARSSTADGSSDWVAVTVDSAGDTGAWASLAVVNGQPAISYIDQSNYALRYAWSSSADGLAGWETVLVDGTTHFIGPTCLALVDGCPAIAYYDEHSYHLNFARASSPDGSAGWTFGVADASQLVGSHPLLVDAGKPAICYYDAERQDMRLARNSLADGSGQWKPTLVASASAVADSSDAALVLANGQLGTCFSDDQCGLQFVLP